MFDRILNQLLQLDLDTFQATNVLPRHVGDLHCSLAQRTRIALTESPLKKTLVLIMNSFERETNS